MPEAALLREQPCRGKAQAPSIGARVRAVGPIAHSRTKADLLSTECGKLGHYCVDRNRPFFGFPVVGGFRVHGERHGVGGCVGQKRLQKRVADVVILVGPNRPKMIGQPAIGPTALLLERHHSRPNRKGVRRKIAATSRQKEYRTSAPYPSRRSGCLRREEERLYDIPNTGFVEVPDVRGNDRNNRSGDHIPVLVQRERKNRLNVQHPLAPTSISAVAIVIVQLKRKTDQICNRVGQFLRKLGVARSLLSSSRRGGQCRRDADNSQSGISRALMTRHLYRPHFGYRRTMVRLQVTSQIIVAGLTSDRQNRMATAPKT